MEATFKLLMSLASNLWHWRPWHSWLFNDTCSMHSEGSESGAATYAIPAKKLNYKKHVLVNLRLLIATLIAKLHPFKLVGSLLQLHVA